MASIRVYGYEKTVAKFTTRCNEMSRLGEKFKKIESKIIDFS